MVGSAFGPLTVGRAARRLVDCLPSPTAADGVCMSQRPGCGASFFPFLSCIPAGSLVLGTGLDKSVPWPVIAVGLALCQVGITLVNTIVLTYLTDCYQDVAPLH